MLAEVHDYFALHSLTQCHVLHESLDDFAGKGIVGWVETHAPQENAALAAKIGGSALWNSFGTNQAPGNAKSSLSAPHDVKVVVGNKAMMAEEDILISKSTDEYMRDMEVSTYSYKERLASLLTLKEQ